MQNQKKPEQQNAYVVKKPAKGPGTSQILQTSIGLFWSSLKRFHATACVCDSCLN